MQIAQKPENEAGRLKALQASALLDSDSEERFDRLTRLAQRVFDVPIVLISLIDERRQWFKSRQGLDACETNRDVAFCAHAILQDDIFEVHDARQDPRFADNPVVTGPPYVCFYAGAPVHDQQGHVLGTLCLIDHQPRRLSERERSCLRDLADCIEDEISTIDRHTLAAVVQQTTNAVIITDAGGRITWVNPGFSSQTGYAFDEVRGRAPASFLQGPRTSLATAAEITRALAQQSAFEVEILNYHRSGRPFWVHITCNPLIDRSGQHVGYCVIQSDIEKIKATEQLKREFTVTISHEMRTPLTSLTGALDLLDEGVVTTLPDSVQRLIGIARNNSRRLRALIDDVLDMEKLLAGKMDFQLQAHALDQLLEQSVNSHQTYAADRDVGVVLNTRCPNLEIITDADRFQQVMSNLLSNAIKFSPDGERVQICARQVNDRACIEVIDHGPGISEPLQERLFQAFAQANASDNRNRGGTGLGLSISRELVEQMNGQIGCTSISGQGSRFWFEIPLAQRAPKPLQAAADGD